MAHDKQCKDHSEDGLLRIIRWDCPKAGESYWNRHTHRVEEAREDLTEKFCIVEKGSR